MRYGKLSTMKALCLPAGATEEQLIPWAHALQIVLLSGSESLLKPLLLGFIVLIWDGMGRYPDTWAALGLCVHLLCFPGGGSSLRFVSPGSFSWPLPDKQGDYVYVLYRVPLS